MALLVKLDDPKKGIITPVGIWPENRNTPKIYQAQWNTGASNTLISGKVVNELGLNPVGSSKGGYLDSNGIWRVSNKLVYLINILVSDSLICRDILVNETDLTDVDVIIAMDVISTGDLSLYKNNVCGSTIFSFRLSDPVATDISLKGTTK